MSAKHTRPRGPGYMPKGGAAAAQRANASWEEGQRALTPPPPVPSPVVPDAVPVRASARVSWPSTTVLARVGAVSGLLALVLEAVSR